MAFNLRSPPQPTIIIGLNCTQSSLDLTQTFAVAVDAVLVVLVLEHLADEDLQSVLHLLLALLLHFGASVAIRRHPDSVDERERGLCSRTD